MKNTLLLKIIVVILYGLIIVMVVNILDQENKPPINKPKQEIIKRDSLKIHIA